MADERTISAADGDSGSVAPDDSPIGLVVGGCLVQEVAGSGGMGVVYRAYDRELERTVALKVISPTRARDPRFRELFVRESRTAASLEHPGIIPIYRAGDEAGRLYIAMRFVDGVSLRDLLAAGPLPVARATRIVARVAEALDAAHARGLVHRDVKPGNVMIGDPDGEEVVYLTDFGLSVAAVASAEGPGRRSGTIGYLAPEQVRGDPLDARTDVYALGCVLHHALAGSAPFADLGEDEAIEAHLESAPPAIGARGVEVPPALEEVVRTAMAKRPADRFASAGELGRAALAARFDLALCHGPDDRAAAGEVAAALREAGTVAALAGGGAAAADVVRASGACAILVGPAGLGGWSRDALAAARELAGGDRAFRTAAVILPGGPDPLDPSLAFLADAPWADMRGGVDSGVDDLLRVLRGAAAPVLGHELDVCPYKGLEYFAEEDADDFFGREAEVARLLAMLRAGRFLAVVGPSGSGKSSLVQAGLLPAIRRGGLPGGASWPVVRLTPGPHPLATLATRLAALPGAGAPSAADLGAAQGSLDHALARMLDGRPPGQRVLIVCDQLEEAFTLCADPGERAAFLDALAYAATIPGGRAVVVVTLRADFYHHVAEHPAIQAAVAARQLSLGAMDAAGLRRAIERPAGRAGLQLEPGLARRILTDVADRPGSLPLLEHLLLELWHRRVNRTLTLEAYGALGGVDGALARRANITYGALPPQRREVARRILLRLTQPGEGTEDTRRRVEMRELSTGRDAPADVEAVVGSLVEARLLAAGTDHATGAPVVEVTHEALIRGWPELRGWIDEDRERLRLQRRLTEAAREWETGGRDEALLYRGSRLAAWDERDTADLTGDERAFLAASRARAEGERSARRRRVQVAIAGLAVALAAIAAVAAYALVQRGDADEQRSLATSRQLAAAAELRLGSDPELALLLARSGYRERATPEAEEILRQATHRSQVRASFGDHMGVVVDVAYSADGRAIVSAGVDGTVRVRPPAGGAATVIRAGAPVRTVDLSPDGGTIATGAASGAVALWTPTGARVATPRGHSGPVEEVAFSPDGRLLASAGDDGAVRLWSVAGRRQVRRIAAPAEAGAALALAFSPDGRTLGTGYRDARVRLWPVSGGPPAVLRGHDGNVLGVAFSPDGRSLATGAGDSTVRLWDLEPRPRPRRTLPAGRIFGPASVAYSPDGGEIVAAGLDGVVRIWSASGTALAQLRGHDGGVEAAAFSPDGRAVASAGDDGSIRVWAWRQLLPGATARGDADFLYGGPVAFAASGTEVLSPAADGSLRRLVPGASRLRTVLGPLPGDYYTAGATTPDGERFAVALADAGDIVVRGTGADRAPLRLRGHQSSVWALAFSDDGRTLVSGGADGSVRVWDVGRGVARTVLGGEGGVVWSLDVSRDGRWAVAGSQDGAVRLWPLGDGDPRVLRGHVGAVQSVAFSPDGARVASGGDDLAVRIWDLGGGDPMVLRGHQATVYSVAFDDPGGRLLSVAQDGARVVDTATGRTVLTIPSPGRKGFRGAISPDGGRLALVTLDNDVQTYACATCGPVEDVLELAGERTSRDLTAAERETYSIGD